MRHDKPDGEVFGHNLSTTRAFVGFGQVYDKVCSVIAFQCRKQGAGSGRAKARGFPARGRHSARAVWLYPMTVCAINRPGQHFWPMAPFVRTLHQRASCALCRGGSFSGRSNCPIRSRSVSGKLWPVRNRFQFWPL
jgi:hypothetical protein